MLKIKDNVDLKILELYGFKPVYKDYYIYEYFVETSLLSCIRVNAHTRIITVAQADDTQEFLIIIYNLITDGIVEVEEFKNEK